MTSFRRMNKVLLTDKIKTVGWIISAYIVVILLSLLPDMFNGSFFSKQWSAVLMQHAMSWSWLATLLAFIFLTWISEKVYTSNRYRLIPVSDTKLYLSNILSSLIAFILVSLVELIFVLIFYLFNMKQVSTILSSSFSGVESRVWLLLLALVLVSLAGILFWWAMISLIHLLATAISRALPANHQTLYKIIIYIVLIYIAIWMFNKLQAWISQLAYLQYMMYSSSVYTGPMWTALIMFVIAVVISAVNIWLLNKEVETKQ